MIYIHIGFHKTGSSTIQHFAARAADQLRDVGIIYPEIGRTNAAHFNLVEELRGSALFVEKRGTFADLREAIQAAPTQDYLLSSEAFHLLDEPAVRKLSETLGSAEVRVIAYLRDLPTIAVSAYLQTAKTGVFLENFDEAFRRRFNRGRDEPPREFEELKTWAGVFGWDALRVRLLDPRHLHDGDLLMDFLSGLGRDSGMLDRSPPESIRARNISPGWKTVELIRSMHRASGSYTDQKQHEAFRQIRRGAQIIRAAGEKIGEEIGLNAEKGAYLTREQWDVACGANDQLFDALEKHLAGPPFPTADATRFSPRHFLPEAERVPDHEQATFYQQMTFALAQAMRAFSVGEGLARRLRTVGGERGALADKAMAKRKIERAEQRRARKAARATNSPPDGRMGTVRDRPKKHRSGGEAEQI